MAPIKGAFECLLLVADDADEALVAALLPPHLRPSAPKTPKLVFELGRQHGAGPPLMGLDFMEGKIQIPDVIVDGHVFCVKAVLWFDSRLMQMSSAAIGLRSVHPGGLSRAGGDYQVKGALHARVEPAPGVAVDVEELRTLMCSPWVGSRTGGFSYQHVYDFAEAIKAPSAVTGTVRLHLPSMLVDAGYAHPRAGADGWLELPVRGADLYAPWRLEGPRRR